jgi:hypothetical protein
VMQDSVSGLAYNSYSISVGGSQSAAGAPLSAAAMAPSAISGLTKPFTQEKVLAPVDINHSGPDPGTTRPVVNAEAVAFVLDSDSDNGDSEYGDLSIDFSVESGDVRELLNTRLSNVIEVEPELESRNDGRATAIAPTAASAPISAQPSSHALRDHTGIEHIINFELNDEFSEDDLSFFDDALDVRDIDDDIAQTGLGSQDNHIAATAPVQLPAISARSASSAWSQGPSSTTEVVRTRTIPNSSGSSFGAVTATSIVNAQVVDNDINTGAGYSAVISAPEADTTLGNVDDYNDYDDAGGSIDSFALSDGSIESVSDLSSFY